MEQIIQMYDFFLFAKNRRIFPQFFSLISELLDPLGPFFTCQRSLYDKIRALSEKNHLENRPILIAGPSGSEKTILARLFHEISFKKQEPFTTLDCATLRSKERLQIFLSTCKSGDLYFDNMEMLNDKFHKVFYSIMEKFFACNARIIMSVTVEEEKDINWGIFGDLAEMVKKNTIHIPALRKRPSDLNLLISHYLQNEIFTVSPKALELLKNWFWPNNLHEFRETAFCLLVEYLDHDTNCISEQIIKKILDLAVPERYYHYQLRLFVFLFGLANLKNLGYKKALDIYETILLETSLDSGQGLSKTARALGLPISTLASKINSHNSRQKLGEYS